MDKIILKASNTKIEKMELELKKISHYPLA